MWFSLTNKVYKQLELKELQAHELSKLQETPILRDSIETSHNKIIYIYELKLCIACFLLYVHVSVQKFMCERA